VLSRPMSADRVRGLPQLEPDLRHQLVCGAAHESIGSDPAGNVGGNGQQPGSHPPRAMTRALSVAVRVKPGAQREHVGGSYPGPYGPALVISVRARAVDGAATEATLGQRITNLLAPATS
ncbi:MAG: DUF167 domain-containing protein, partial [Pseudonocardiaceae bacterium]